MANKYARKLFLPVVTLPDGFQILDYLSTKWIEFPKFLKGRSVKIIPVTSELIGNLPLIASNEYGNVHLFWIIGYANSVINPFEEVSVGTSLLIPSLGDIEEFTQLNTSSTSNIVTKAVTLPKIVI